MFLLKDKNIWKSKKICYETVIIKGSTLHNSETANTYDIPQCLNPSFFLNRDFE